MAKKEVLNVTQDTKTILNGIRAQASPAYQDSVPLLVDDEDVVVPGVKTTNSVKDVARAITTYQPNMNEFLNALVNRIGLVMFKSMSFTNPLAIFKRGVLEFGETVEEIFIGLAKSYDYAWDGSYTNPTGDETEENPFKREIPDVKTLFHQLNSKKVFKTTTSDSEINLAFTNANGVYSLVNEIVNSLFTAYQVFEWNRMKKLFADSYKANKIVKITVEAPTTEATTKALVQRARKLSRDLTFPSTTYNSQSVTMTTNLQDQYVFITSELEANMDVNVLAAAFNMNKTEFLGHLVVIDSFPEGMEDVEMVVVDRDYFNIWDKKIQVETQYNPAQMYWNYFLHVWQLYSSSPFVNAVALVTSTGG